MQILDNKTFLKTKKKHLYISTNSVLTLEINEVSTLNLYFVFFYDFEYDVKFLG